MAMSTNERLDTLENALKELAYAGRHTEIALAEFAEQHRQTDIALKESDARFKEELRESAHRLDRVLKESAERLNAQLEKSVAERDRAIEESSNRFDERLEMRAVRLEAQLAKANASSNKRWGELANKMGSFVEDIVRPNFPHILERYFGGAELDEMRILMYQRHPKDRSKRKEFDLVAWTEDTVFWSETKSTATVERFRDFARDTTSVFEFFPETAGKRLVKIGCALAIPPRVVSYLTKHGCYAMMLGDETMDIVNFEVLSPR